MRRDKEDGGLFQEQQMMTVRPRPSDITRGHGDIIGSEELFCHSVTMSLSSGFRPHIVTNRCVILKVPRDSLCFVMPTATLHKFTSHLLKE